MKEKELLRKLGQETIYTAKGHFKACDVRRHVFTWTLWICMLLNIAGILDLESTLSKIVAIASLTATIFLLMWNEGEGKDYRKRHRDTAEKYLAVHKEIRHCYFQEDIKGYQVSHLSRKVIDLDTSDKPELPDDARKLAKRAIEKPKPETDNWFLKHED